MKSREQIAIEALTEAAKLALQCHGLTLATNPPRDAWEHHRASDRLKAALAGVEAITPPAQGSIDADGPPSVADTVRHWMGENDVVLSKQAYRTMCAILADRAARQSAAPGERAATQASCAIDALDGLGYKYDAELGWLPPPAPSEPVPRDVAVTDYGDKPVPQGVPEGFALVPLRMNREMARVVEEDSWDWADLLVAAEAVTEEQFNEINTAPTATSGGEAVAWRVRIGVSDMWSYCDTESDADFYGKQSGLNYEKQALYLAPPPLPATDVASVRKAMNVAATMGNVLYNLAQRQGYVLTDADCEMYSNLRKEWDAIRALISKEG